VFNIGVAQACSRVGYGEKGGGGIKGEAISSGRNWICWIPPPADIIKANFDAAV